MCLSVDSGNCAAYSIRALIPVSWTAFKADHRLIVNLWTTKSRMIDKNERYDLGTRSYTDVRTGVDSHYGKLDL